MSESIEFDASEPYTPEWRGNKAKATPFTVGIYRLSVLELEDFRAEIAASAGLKEIGTAVAKVIDGPHPAFKLKTARGTKLIETPEQLCLETPRTLVEELLAAVHEVQGFKGVREKNSAVPSGGVPTTETTPAAPASPENGATAPTVATVVGVPSTPALQ